MIVFMAHQLGHKVSISAAAPVVGGASSFRPASRSGWSERWRLVSRVFLCSVGGAS